MNKICQFNTGMGSSVVLPQVCLLTRLVLQFWPSMCVLFAAPDKVDDPVCDVQISRMLELPCLYREVYDKPFQGPEEGQR